MSLSEINTLRELDTQSPDLTTLPPTPQPRFPLFSLPLELRLKIYAYLLPPRRHIIATQLPSTGSVFFYNTSTSHLPSTYPFGRTSPSSTTPLYKVLSSNFHASFPLPSIYPSLLRVSRQIHTEAEPILYSAPGVFFDFGIHLDAVKAFWGDRSEVARKSARGLRVARELSVLSSEGRWGTGGPDRRWMDFCRFVEEQLMGLRELDLTIWTGSGSVAAFPAMQEKEVEEEMGWEVEREVEAMQLKRWRDWEWTCDLLKLESLKKAKITWWRFQGLEAEAGEVHFDAWLAGRMVADGIVKERLIKEGIVVEESVVLPGFSA